MNAHLSLALLLVAAALPLAQVQAHTCDSAAPVSPSDPTDPDTGCNGSSCPCTSSPHDHSNTAPPQSCSKEKEDCTDRRGGCPPRDVVADLGIVEVASVNFRVACAVVGHIVAFGALTRVLGPGGDLVEADLLP